MCLKTILFVVDCSSSMSVHEDDVKTMLKACVLHFRKHKTGLLAYNETSVQLFGVFLPKRSSVRKADVNKMRFVGQPNFLNASVHLKFVCRREENVTVLHFTDGKTAYAVSTRSLLKEIGAQTIVISIDSTMPLGDLYDFCPVYPYKHGIEEILEKISEPQGWFRLWIRRLLNALMK
jgi:hypothetical protein